MSIPIHSRLQLFPAGSGKHYQVHIPHAVDLTPHRPLVIHGPVFDTFKVFRLQELVKTLLGRVAGAFGANMANQGLNHFYPFLMSLNREVPNMRNPPPYVHVGIRGLVSAYRVRSTQSSLCICR